MKWCVFCELRWQQPNLQIWTQYGDFRFWRICGQQKSDFSQLVPESSNGALCVSYAESSLTCKFELKTEILDFGRFELKKDPTFQTSSQWNQMVRFVLVTLRTA